MATRKRDRIIALGIALFFFLLASGLSIMVIVQAITSKNNQTSNSTPPTKKTVQGTQLQGFTPTSKVTALKITDTKVGTGDEAKAGDTVTVLYTGAVASTGTIFQSTDDTGNKPIQIQLIKGAAIDGWVNGVPGMKVGGTRQLLIPADQAYGKAGQPQGGIPPNAPLVFNVTLLGVSK